MFEELSEWYAPHPTMHRGLHLYVEPVFLSPWTVLFPHGPISSTHPLNVPSCLPSIFKIEKLFGKAQTYQQVLSEDLLD